MLPIPAIDLKDGQCVRLKQGRMEDATVFSDNPVEMAAHWIQQGATRLHLVDLNGAFAGSPQNAEVVKQIAKRFPHIPLQIGGGIRDEATAKHYWDLGVKYVIIGSKAVSDPEFVAALAEKYPKRIILGIDAKNGYVATDGWAKISDTKATELAKRFDPKTIAAIIYTDISKDGMMGGVNITQTAELAGATAIPVIASGGVASLADITGLRDATPKIYGTIVGRAIYDGAFTLKQAYQAAASIKTTDNIQNSIYQDALAIRKNVFIQEQGVPENLEIDANENQCHYLVLYNCEGKAIATARILLKDEGKTAKIQRVAVIKEARHNGIGTQIMEATTQAAKTLGATTASLSSQTNALGFYEKLGFTVCSDVYDDAGIPHKDMKKSL